MKKLKKLKLKLISMANSTKHTYKLGNITLNNKNYVIYAKKSSKLKWHQVLTIVFLSTVALFMLACGIAYNDNNVQISALFDMIATILIISTALFAFMLVKPNNHFINMLAMYSTSVLSLSIILGLLFSEYILGTSIDDTLNMSEFSNSLNTNFTCIAAFLLISHFIYIIIYLIRAKTNHYLYSLINLLLQIVSGVLTVLGIAMYEITNLIFHRFIFFYGFFLSVCITFSIITQYKYMNSQNYIEQ